MFLSPPPPCTFLPFLAFLPPRLLMSICVTVCYAKCDSGDNKTLWLVREHDDVSLPSSPSPSMVSGGGGDGGDELSAFLTAFASLPSMHTCFALLLSACFSVTMPFWASVLVEWWWVSAFSLFRPCILFLSGG